MRWLDRQKPPAALTCAYCGAAGAFPHAFSIEYAGREFALFRCTACGSLHYDPPEVLAHIEHPYTEAYKENTRTGTKYFLETGYAPDLIVYCALAALAGRPDELLAERQFVDIGAGIGLSSAFIRDVRGIPPVAIEPAYMGELGQELLGLEFHRAFFEDLPGDVIRRLQVRPCLLHLNSVIEHLADPAEPVRQALARVEVETFAVIVPDADTIDPGAAMSTMLHRLAPGDHLHLPTEEGMRRFMRRLGFAHVAIGLNQGLIVAVGARRPVALPTPGEVKAGEAALLRCLLDNPHPWVSGGAAARLLQLASNAERLDEVADLRARLEPLLHRPTLLDQLRNAADPWREVPYHICVTGYCLALAALRQGQAEDGFGWLDVVDAAAARMRGGGFGPYGVQSIDFGWAARLLRGDALSRLCRFAEARARYAEVRDAAGDLVAGPTRRQVAAATIRLRDLTGLRGLVTSARMRVLNRNELAPSYSVAPSRLRALHPASLVFYVMYAGYLIGAVVRHRRVYAQYISGFLRYHGGLVAYAVARWVRVAPGRFQVGLRHAVAVRREARPLRALAAAARKLLRAMDNAHNIDIASNGEAFLLRAILLLRPGEVIDIGARDGPFSALAAGLGAPVHAFDDRLDQLAVFRARCAGWRVRFNEFVPRDLDAYAAAHCSPPIAMLRLAVPGSEDAILAGCPRLLSRTAAIRFAHGPENAAARVFLADLRAPLEAAGFVVFHLLPRRLRPLDGTEPEFSGRLYVALRPELAASLQLRP
jgi:hypothetical protein